MDATKRRFAAGSELVTLFNTRSRRDLLFLFYSAELWVGGRVRVESERDARVLAVAAGASSLEET